MNKREIKFRAKSITGGWLYWVIFDGHSRPPEPLLDIKTISQYTGLKDKNGKDIYEGDLIDFAGLKPIEIVWRNVGFQSKLIPYEKSEPIYLSQEGMTIFGEIIGNIYENI